MNDEIKFSQENILFRPKQLKVYPIQEHDWMKMKKTVEECNSKSVIVFKDTALLLFGGSVSAFLSLIALYNSEEVASWVLNTNWIVLISALVIGTACMILHKQQQKVTERDLSLIIREMEDIESKFHKTSEENITTKSYARSIKNYLTFSNNFENHQ